MEERGCDQESRNDHHGDERAAFEHEIDTEQSGTIPFDPLIDLSEISRLGPSVEMGYNVPDMVQSAHPAIVSGPSPDLRLQLLAIPAEVKVEDLGKQFSERIFTLWIAMTTSKLHTGNSTNPIRNGNVGMVH